MAKKEKLKWMNGFSLIWLVSLQKRNTLKELKVRVFKILKLLDRMLSLKFKLWLFHSCMWISNIYCHAVYKKKNHYQNKDKFERGTCLILHIKDSFSKKICQNSEPFATPTYFPCCWIYNYSNPWHVCKKEI